MRTSFPYTASLFFTVFLLTIASSAIGQQVHEPAPMSKDWARPYPPFRIAGNLYYVGTYELACYLMTTSEGNILVNTGLAPSDAQLIANIRALGFNVSDTKMLLTNQAHFDHVGAMAAIKKRTGAKLAVDAKDAPSMADGGASDYAFGGHGSSFMPVIPDEELKDGDTIRLGEMEVVMKHHPGHTKGSCSFLFTVKDERRAYRVLLANLPSIVVDEKWSEITAYPEIAKDYAYTFTAMKNISFDIWLAAHASQFRLHEKHRPGDKYNPDAFIDHEGYKTALNRLEEEYNKRSRE